MRSVERGLRVGGCHIYTPVTQVADVPRRLQKMSMIILCPMYCSTSSQSRSTRTDVMADVVACLLSGYTLSGAL